MSPDDIKEKPQFSRINSLLAVTSIIAVFIAGFFIWQNGQLKKLLAIQSFDDCVSDKKSRKEVAEKEKCITQDGRVFEKEIQKEDEKKEVSWKKYEQQDFSFEYPSELEIKEQEDKRGKTVKLVYLGPSQEENTELYDGYSFSITELKGKKQNPLALAKESRKNSLEICENKEDISEIEETEIGKIKAYKYESNCFGNSTTIIFLENQEKLYEITTTWVKEKDYKTITDKVIASLKFSL